MSHLKEARFRATTGPKEGFGTTPQEALTALMRKTSGDAFSPIVIWPYNLGDAYFTEAQQARLQELKGRQETLTAEESRVGRANRSLLRCHHSPHEGTDASATEERTLMNVPATINKLFKVVQYGYLREPILPSATLPSGLVLHKDLIRPVENIAICELNGKFVPVFCTRDWKMVPAGFDSTLEQNQDMTLERARRIPVEVLGQDVLVWHDLTQPPATDFFGRKLQQPNSVEALSWVQQEDGVLRTFGDGVSKGFAGERAIKYVQRLYHRGAVKVIAIEVQRDRGDWVRKVSVERGLPETDITEATDQLVVELPNDPQARAGLFEQWVTTFGRKKWDVPVDDGQKYLYFGWQ